MNYGRIIKRAWQITWRYKILWLFGLLAGTTSSGNFNYRTSSSDYDQMPPEIAHAFDNTGMWLQDNVSIIIAIAALLVLVGIVFWVVSIAARGGLIHLVNEAEENRQVKAGPGWSAGFSNWGRLFLVRLVLFGPFVIVMIILFVTAILPIIVAAIQGDDAVLPAIMGTCGLIAIAAVLALLAGTILEVLAQLGERYVVLDHQGPIVSIKSAWNDVRTRFPNVALIWLILFAIGIGFGIVLAVVGIIFLVGAVILLAALGPVGLVGGAFIIIVAMALPSAVYATFVSSVWTVFWRELTGKNVIPVREAAPSYQPEGVPDLPAPPAMPEPPAAP